MLSREKLIRYLVDQDLLSPYAVVNGEVAIEDDSRRNVNLKVRSSVGPSYFIKVGAASGQIETLSNEAFIYEILVGCTRSDLSGYRPEFVRYDADCAVLVLRLLDEAFSFWQCYASHSHPPLAAHAELGGALGLLHKVSAEDLVQPHRPHRFPIDRPWVLSIHRPSINLLPELSNANIELIKIIQDFPALCEGLDLLREDWAEKCLIHFDLKWDNVLIDPASSEAHGNIRIVDWELAGPGDPCWDLGSVFHEYLRRWLTSMPIADGVPTDRQVELAQYPIDEFHASVRSFWQSYLGEMGVNETAARLTLIRAMRYAAARLVQSSYEEAKASAQPSATAISSLQLSMNILGRPEEAAAALLGL